MQLGMQNRGWIAALLAIAALVAIACGDSATATPVPTATVTPAPTAAPSPTPAVTNPGLALTAEEADYIEQVRIQKKKQKKLFLQMFCLTNL